MYHKYEEMVKYLIGGVMSTIVNWAVYAICSRGLCIHYMVSNAIAFIIGLIFAYVVNKVMVFESKSFHPVDVCREFFLFSFGRVASWGIETVLMYTCVEIIVMNDLVAKFICLMVVTVTNYLFSKLLVFRKGK